MAHCCCVNVSVKRRSVQGVRAPVSCPILAPNDAAVRFIVYNYAKNAFNVQVVTSKETKFGPDCIFLTLCAGKSAFGPVSPDTLSQCPCLHQEGTRHICSVKNILNLNRSRGDTAWTLLWTLLFRDFIWWLLWKYQNLHLCLTFQNDFYVNVRVKLIMNSRLSYMDTGAAAVKSLASHKMKHPPAWLGAG